MHARPIVVNLRAEQYDIYIGRGSVYGNPFTHLTVEDTQAIFQVRTRDESIDMYEAWLTESPGLYARYPLLDTPYWIARRQVILDSLPLLAGMRLGCYCRPKSCHGDVLAELWMRLYFRKN